MANPHDALLRFLVFVSQPRPAEWCVGLGGQLPATVGGAESALAKLAALGYLDAGQKDDRGRTLYEATPEGVEEAHRSMAELHGR